MKPYSAVILYASFTCALAVINITANQTTSQHVVSGDVTHPCYQVRDEEGNSHSYYCSHLDSSFHISELPHDVSHLILQHSNITFSTLLGEDRNQLSQLKSIKLSHCHIGKSNQEWLQSLTGLEQLTIDHCWSSQPKKSASIFSEAPVYVLEIDSLLPLNLPSLKMDMHACNITVPSAARSSVSQLQLKLLNITGGSFECHDDYSWLLNMVKSGMASVTNSTCFTLTDNFFYAGKAFIQVMKYKKETQELCPERCKCSMTAIRTINRPLVHVDCPNADLTELPHGIPPYTTRGNFSYNRITDLSPLFTNKNYSKVTLISVSHNLISHINGKQLYEYLSGRNIDIAVHLDHNQLTRFPVEEVAKIYEMGHSEGSKFFPVFYLGHNPWDCDCDFLPQFQTLVYRQIFDIKDHLSIHCSPSNLTMLYVDVAAKCTPSEPLLYPLDILNIMLAVMLVLILANFVYDYDRYKKHGKLPWIITKIRLC